MQVVNFCSALIQILMNPDKTILKLDKPCKIREVS